MDRDTLDRLWQQALMQSVADGEQFTRYRFAALVAAHEREECAALVKANADACDPGSVLRVYLASNAAAIRIRT